MNGYDRNLLRCGLIYDVLGVRPSRGNKELIKKISELKLRYKDDPEMLHLLLVAREKAPDRQYKRDYPGLKAAVNKRIKRYGEGSAGLMATFQGGLLTWPEQKKDRRQFFNELDEHIMKNVPKIQVNGTVGTGGDRTRLETALDSVIRLLEKSYSCDLGDLRCGTYSLQERIKVVFEIFEELMQSRDYAIKSMLERCPLNITTALYRIYEEKEKLSQRINDCNRALDIIRNGGHLQARIGGGRVIDLDEEEILKRLNNANKQMAQNEHIIKYEKEILLLGSDHVKTRNYFCAGIGYRKFADDSVKLLEKFGKDGKNEKTLSGLKERIKSISGKEAAHEMFFTLLLNYLPKSTGMRALEAGVKEVRDSLCAFMSEKKRKLVGVAVGDEQVYVMCN